MDRAMGLTLLAALGGLAAGLQAHFMGLMDRGMGTRESVFITYGGGGLIVGVLMALFRGGNLSGWQNAPGYALTAGVIGLVIVSTIGYTTPRLGLVTALTIVVASQFITGAVIDHFGIFGAAPHRFDFQRLLGIGALLLGVWLLTR